MFELVIFFMSGLQRAESFPATRNFTIIIILHFPVLMSHSLQLESSLEGGERWKTKRISKLKVGSRSGPAQRSEPYTIKIGFHTNHRHGLSWAWLKCVKCQAQIIKCFVLWCCLDLTRCVTMLFIFRKMFIGGLSWQTTPGEIIFSLISRYKR